MTIRAFLIGAVLCGGSFLSFSPSSAAQSGPPKAELHVWGGNDADDSGSVDLRSIEGALWLSVRDRVAVRYDNSLSLDNPALARSGISADAFFLNYLHDFSGNYLVALEVGRRDLPNDASQDILKVEAVRLRDNRASKIGLQLSPTDDAAGSHTDTVVFASYNFPVTERWRVEPALFLARTGSTRDDEYRLAGYAEYNAASRWQLGLGAGVGQVDSVAPEADGEVLSAHARLSVPFSSRHRAHLQVRFEDAPLNEYTVALVGVSLMLDRR